MVRPSGPHEFRLVGFVLSGQRMTPVCVYVDGFNLYHALARFKDDKVKWLDLATLADRLIAPKTEKVQSVFYFSAFAHWLPAKMARHQIYVKALEARGVTCVLGHRRSWAIPTISSPCATPNRRSIPTRSGPACCRKSFSTATARLSFGRLNTTRCSWQDGRPPEPHHEPPRSDR